MWIIGPHVMFSFDFRLLCRIAKPLFNLRKRLSGVKLIHFKMGFLFEGVAVETGTARYEG